MSLFLLEIRRKIFCVVFFYKKDIKIKRKENALSRGKLKKEQLPCEQFL